MRCRGKGRGGALIEKLAVRIDNNMGRCAGAGGPCLGQGKCLQAIKSKKYHEEVSLPSINRRHRLNLHCSILSFLVSLLSGCSCCSCLRFKLSTNAPLPSVATQTSAVAAAAATLLLVTLLVTMLTMGVVISGASVTTFIAAFVNKSIGRLVLILAVVDGGVGAAAVTAPISADVVAPIVADVIVPAEVAAAAACAATEADGRLMIILLPPLGLPSEDMAWAISRMSISEESATSLPLGSTKCVAACGSCCCCCCCGGGGATFALLSSIAAAAAAAAAAVVAPTGVWMITVCGCGCCGSALLVNTVLLPSVVSTPVGAVLVAVCVTPVV